MRRSVLLKNNSEHLILSDSLLKKFETESFDVLSVPGARPKDLWDFLPPHNKYKKNHFIHRREFSRKFCFEKWGF